MNKQQLANRIWASANKMRSKIDASEYKDYILGLIFYKFLSDNEVAHLKKSGWTDEDLPNLVEKYDDSDMTIIIEDCKSSIGYFIEYKNLFTTWLLPESAFSVADLSVALNRFDALISPTYQHVYKGIFITLQAGLSKLGESPAAQTKALKELIKLIKDIPTDGSQDYDVLGYVYEYLISNFAANAGKKAGEFYTPHEVAILMSEIVAEHHKDKKQIEIYDPTSGSGSLLITIGKSVGRHIEDRNRVKYYAQELKENTYNLTRMNLVMRGIRPGNIITRCADSLSEDWPVVTDTNNSPLYVDAVVSNPPYSQHWDPRDAQYDARFQNYGVAPASKADYAFLLHELHHIKPDGILTIVMPHGVLFRGNPNDEGEGKIRKNLIERNQIDCIIGLPANIFFGTGIPTLIMVLKQNRKNDDVLIIDASKGFVKEGKQNKLRACDIKRIADAVRDRKDVEGFSKKVSRDEIRENNYNLNIPRYVDSSEAPEQYDIYATMFGGIPNAEIDMLRRYWEVLPSLRGELFQPEADKPYSKMKAENVSETIGQNGDVVALQNQFNKVFNGFADALHDRLITDYASVNDLKALHEIAEDVFKRVDAVPLVDRYAVYQAVSNKWQTIISDIEMLQSEGLDAARVVEEATKIVKKDGEEVEVSDGLKGRIIPFELVQSEKFNAELQDLNAKEARLEDIASEVQDVIDGFTDEEAEEYMEEDETPKADKKKIKRDAKSRGEEIEPETKEKLKQLVALWDEQTKLNKALKAGRQELVEKTKNAIEHLTDEEIAHFLHLKWIEPICEGIDKTLADELITLEKSVSRLSSKYAISYNELNNQLDDAQSELTKMIENLTGDEFSIKGLNLIDDNSK